MKKHTPVEPRAYTIDAFSAAHGIGRVRVYEEIKSGALRAVRAGGKTLILDVDAAAWRASLPTLTLNAA